MIEINETLFLQLINFLIMVFFLNHFLFKPILEIAERRSGKLRSLSGDTARLVNNAEKAVEQYEAKMEEMKKETAAILANARLEAAREHERVVREARAKFAGQLEEAKARIGEESDVALTQLRKEAQGISRDIAGRILGRNVG